MTNGQTVTTWGIGTGTSVAAWWVAHVGIVNQTMQFIVLTAGLAVSLLSIRKLTKKKKDKK